MSKDYHTAASVADTAAQVLRIGNEIQAASERMKKAKVGKIEVNFEKSRVKCLVGLDNWVATLQRAIREKAAGVDSNFTAF